MSDLDTRKAGSGQTASFATVRLESQSLLPEQLVDRIKAVHDDTRDVDVRIEEYGTGTASQ
ncbi:MAG TPA: hypothetical protein VG474_14025 [Solirubrobacteraceae bacterium]|nr:hypothetical protein [Solirubrobacteraceae bacterium]